MSASAASAVAIVGAGRMARAHAAAWAALGVPVRWIVSPRLRPELWETAELRLAAARWTPSLAEALADPAVTIVSVCTPTPTHPALAAEALEAGRHVLLEKPVALTLADALALEEVAARAPGVLMVAHVVRFFAGYAALADRVRAGSVGAPRLVRAERVSEAPRGAEWLADEESSGGLLVDYAIHDFDQANALLGEPVAVTSVRAGAGGGGAAGGRPSVAGRATALPAAGPGAAPATSALPTTHPFAGAIATTVEYAAGGVAQILSVVDLPQGTPFRAGLEVVGTSGVDAVGSEEGDPFLAQAAYFLACAEAGTEPGRAPLAAAIDALRVSLAARESLRTGARVPVPARG